MTEESNNQVSWVSEKRRDIITTPALTRKTLAIGGNLINESLFELTAVGRR